MRGLLASDLLIEEKRATLKLICSSKKLLADITDVLNIRLSFIEEWSWDGAVLAEQRRQRGGRYRIFHDEDLLDSLFLQFIGTKWSVKFKHALAIISRPEVTAMTSHDSNRRRHSIAENAHGNVSQKRKELFKNENFLSQLLQREDEVFRGYDDDNDNDENENDQQCHLSEVSIRDEAVLAPSCSHGDSSKYRAQQGSHHYPVRF